MELGTWFWLLIGRALEQVTIGIVMVAIASSYFDDCNNGATTYLFLGGVVILVANFMALLLVGSKKIAEMDGKITCGEKCGLYFMASVAGFMTIVDFLTLIWGSIVVFSAWSDWTNEEANHALDLYCAKTPMLFAFVTLVIRWVLVPVFITVASLKAFYWK
eukprot:TRINITY_DN36290_c0_g1_i1.p1 TRINITY_DN36290_c0_g1~~TRINITY_DN36290_c0_g1_i1.p1  ORF type:complete len:174 (-),score=23.32 TRINITY_DN36290_c0_g1_i1:58-540(-)